MRRLIRQSRSWRLCAAAAGFAILTCATHSSRAEMVHRWSFDNNAGQAASGTQLVDSVSESVAEVRGVGATFTGASLILPGTTTGNADDTTISAYVDLPNGIISSKTSLTVEIWATPISAKNWQRLLDFGRSTQTGDGLGAAGEWTGAVAPGTTSASDGIMLSLQRDGNLSTQRMEVMLDGAATTLNTSLSTTAGQQHHYVLVYQSGAGQFASGGQVSWYRDRVLAGSVDVAYPLSSIEDVNNWLGRSQWSADSNANIALNEVRIHNHAFGAADVEASYASGPQFGVLYRWSFNDAAGSVAHLTTISDSISGAQAIVRGQGASFTGQTLVLPGTTTGNTVAAEGSAYVDLPNNLISSLENVTIEAWAAPLSSRTFQRMFDFGNMNGEGDGMGALGEWTGLSNSAPGATTAADEFALTFNIGDDFNAQRLYGRLNYQQTGGLNIYIDSALPTTIGQRYHYVVTFERGVGAHADTGGRQSWYRDGALVASQDLPYPLSDINDVNNWLGRSQFGGDPLAHVSFDEFRIYGFAFTPENVLASRDAGPDTLVGVPAPEAMPDSLTMHAGQKARIEVLANDTGTIQPGSVVVDTPPAAGTATVDSVGRILYVNTNTAAASDSFTYTVTGPGGISTPAEVTIDFTNNLRITNPSLGMPTEPPATFLQVVDALPGVTFSEPICIASVPGDTQRLFVGERLAKIQVVADVTAAQPTKQVFLDLQQMVAGRTPSETILNWSGENGVLGMAFHPNYAANGYFYVAYTVRINNGSYYQRISRLQVSAEDPNVANPGSERILLQQLDEGGNHNGGDLHFGPDGYLYYAAGDEENPNDFRLNSQKIDKDFFTGIFRIDVDKRAGNLEPNAHAAIPTDGGVARFSVPADNPFIHTSLGGDWDGTLNGIAVADLSKVRTEFWAHGLRHPWRMSFDALTGELWAGDVGQNLYEEVNKVVKGGNYGWVYREGAHDTSFTNPAPPPKPAGFTSIDPFYEFPHASIAPDPLYAGNSVCGGYVYRGNRFPSLYGKYVFCDSISGHIWELDPATAVVTRIAGVPGAYGGLVSMGIDPSNQDLLFCDYINGKILRLASGTLGNSFPATLSDTGLFADLTDLSPSPGLLPYEPNLRFWSDYADKRRWFTIPSAEGMITWAKDANWTFPTGMVWVKHFDLELERGNPETKKRLETRVLVKTATGLYGVSYRWNNEETEATLVPDEGVEFNIAISNNGALEVQRWGIPSRASCLTCHTPQAGGALSFSTRQLNRTASLNGFVGNQLTQLYLWGFLANNPGSPNLLPRFLRPEETNYPVEARVRSYLAVNCAYCHRADGTVAGSHWDGRPQLTLEQTHLINGQAENDLGDPANKYIVPGDLAHSIVYNRVAVQNGFTRMPPLATNELDPEAIALLQEWITTSLPARKNYEDWRLEHFGSPDSPDGAPEADPDGDLSANLPEYLANTNPLDASSFPTLGMTTDGSTIDMGFQTPANRSVQVETSTDLSIWTVWDVPGNAGLPLPAGPVTLSGPAEGGTRFFRLRIEEN